MTLFRTLRLGWALALLAGIHPAASAQPITSSRTFEFSYRAEIPAAPAGASTLRVWIPVPQSDAYQDITDLHIDSPIPYRLEQESRYLNQYVYLDVSSAQRRKPLEVNLRFHVVRREHQVLFGGESFSGEEHAHERGQDLAADRLIPTGGVIGALADQVAGPRKVPLEKARALYDYVVTTLKYDKSKPGWGHGDALFACSQKRGNCTDIHSLLVGMLRHCGVPARFEIGFSLPQDQHEGPLAGYHCWAEFYLAPYGWVPVDASEACKDPRRREYFFGAHDANRVQFTLGRDIRLQPTQLGDPLNYSIYPYGEVDGVPFEGIDHQFSFRDLMPLAPNENGTHTGPVFGLRLIQRR